MGCLGRLGCLVVLLVGGAVGVWLYGDRLPALMSRTVERTVERAADGVARTAERVGERLDRPASERIDDASPSDSAPREDSTPTLGAPPASSSRDGRSWVPLRTNGAGTPDPLGPLKGRNAPAYVTLRAEQVAELLAPLRAALPPTAAAPAIAVDDDQLLLRAVVARRDFAGGGGLGALIGATLEGADTLLLAGAFEPVRPGLVHFRVQALTVGAIDIPTRLIPPIARKLRRHLATNGSAPAESSGDDGVADEALPVRLPALVSDLRVVNGRFTVYRNVTGGTR